MLGFSFRIVTSSKSAGEASARIDDFLRSFRAELESMDDNTFLSHVVAVAKDKLEAYDSMADETGSHWSEIVEGRYDFEAFRNECICLKQTTKEQLIAAYDEWLNPLKNGQQNKRRQLVVQVIGSGEGDPSLGRPVFENKTVGDEIDRLVQQFHTSVKHESWGKILHRAATV